MGVSIEQYRQRIGCFARVATLLSNFKVRGYKINTFSQQSKDFGTALRVITRLSCLVVLVAAVIPSSSFVLDLTQFGDVEKNPGPKSAQNYKFHLIDPHQFEKFATTVLKETYKIPFLMVEKGRDEGYDAVESRVDIDLGGGNILKNQNVVVQVKHTTRQSAVLTDAIRKRVFEKEKDKVKKRIADIYIIFTNYQLPFGQCVKLEKIFEDAETKKVVVVGYETLSLWLNSSPELQRKVIRLYPRGHLTDLANCPKAVQSFQLLERYREDLNEIIDVKAFTNAKEIVESDKSFVFITGVPGSGKTTVAKKLVVQLFDKYDSFTYYNITYLNDFDKYWISGKRYIFFMDNILDDDMNKWSELEEKLKIPIEQGSKFVFVGQSIALKQALKASHLNDVYKYLCDGAIDLSNERFNLSKDEKQEMLKKHVEMGDIDSLTKKALLKKKMVSHAAEINCPCFPLVAKSLGSRRRLEEFKSPVPTKRKTPVYNKKFLNTFFEWVRSTNEDSDSISDESCESPPPRLPRQETSGLLKDYKFHLIGDDDFEKFAVTVLGYIYGIKSILTFSKGQDGGRDAVAHGVNIDLGGGNILKNQDLIVQVKHTGKDQPEKITDSVRRKIFEKEKKQVEELVKRNKLETTYIIFSNYDLPSLQEQKLNECYNVAKNVLIIGKETLSQWLNNSPELRRQVLRYYPRGHIKDLTECPIAVKSIQLLDRYREDVEKLKITHIKALTKAKKIMESDKGLVFITGDPRSGKTTLAKQLVVQLYNEHNSFIFYKITYPYDFHTIVFCPENIFFMDNMDSNNMKEWSKLADELEIAIKGGSKFVFAGNTVVQEEAHSSSNRFYDLLSNALITCTGDLSDQQFNLSKDNKQSLTLKRPRHESEPTSTADNGNNITGSSFESCELPTQKRPRLEPDLRSTDNNGDHITALTEVLSKEYKDRISRLPPLPWLGEMRFDLDQVYTKLRIVRRKKNGWQKTNKIVELSDIFDKGLDSDENDLGSDENPRLILIEGSPGMGKTTLSLKLAYEWAMGKMPSKFPPVQLVLLIKCRDMEGDILNEINEQLLPKDRNSLKINLGNFIKEQPGKIMLIVDGLDETSEAASKYVMELLTRKCLRDCYVVATSRQEKGLEVRKHFDTLLEIEGYSKSDIGIYITRYFKDKTEDPALGARLIDNIKTDIKLQTLANNPLNTVLLCVVFEEYRGKLPSTVTELIENIVLCITKRYCEKYSLKVEDTPLETCKETLGKLAYKGLLEDTLSFRESDLNDKTIQCTKMGFLYMEVSEKNIKQDHTYWFLHKTFQEYLSAFYLTEIVKRQELTVGDMIDKLKDTERFMQVLKFVSGMLHKTNPVLHMEFVEKLGDCILLQSKDEDEVKDEVKVEEEDEDGDEEEDKEQERRRFVLGIVCEFLSQRPIDKDMAGIIHKFLPEGLFFDSQVKLYESYRILPHILKLLCTKDGVNKEVHIDRFQFVYMIISASELKLICDALQEKLKVTTLCFDQVSTVDDEIVKERSPDDDPSFTPKSTKILAKALRQNCNLEELYFKDISLPCVGDIMAALTPDSSSMDMAASRRESVLHTLVLQNVECDKQSAFAAAKMLYTNNTLKRLDMSKNSLGSKGVIKIAEALESNRTLNDLCLTTTGCGDEGAAALAEMLHINKTLTNLNISNYFLFNVLCRPSNKIGDEGAKALAGALQKNESLKMLNVHGNSNITVEGVKHFAAALGKNKVLENLYIGNKNSDLEAFDQHTRERVSWLSPQKY